MSQAAAQPPRTPRANSNGPRAYASNASVAQIIERLRSGSLVAAVTHSRPDGDAVGSTLALARALEKAGTKAVCAYLPPWPPRMDRVVAGSKIIHASPASWVEPPLSRADRVAVVDTGSWAQLTEARAWLESRRAGAVIIDHHEHGDAEIADLRLIDTSASAASALVAELCRVMLKLRSCAQLPVDIAEPLYLGIATDTGWFRYSNTTASTMRLAADLIDAGVDHNALYRHVEQNETPARLRLIERALASLELLDSGRAAMITLTREDIGAAGAGQDELGGLSDFPQSIGTVRVVAIVTELEPRLTKVSLRSKAPEAGERVIDVNQIARSLGGGGHVHAAGAKVHAPLAEARAQVAQALCRAVTGAA